MRGELRFAGGKTGLQLLLYRRLEMRLYFTVDVLILSLSPMPKAKVAHRSRRRYFTGSKTRAMARASWRHFERSLARRFLPATVNR